MSNQHDESTYFIPSVASWFDFDNIHQIEMEHNPDFFNEKSFVKTPLNYKEIRNTII